MTRAKYRDVILDTAGRGIAASITVRQTGTATAFSPIYDASGNVLSNPITANANGEFEFYTDDPERVDLYVAISGYTAETVTVDTYDPDDLAELLGEADPFPQYQTEAEVSAQIAAEAPSSPVSSVFGRTGAVTAQQADYDGFFLTPAEGNAAYEAAGAVATHSADTTAVHGITDTSALETTTGSQAKVDTHVNDTSDAHDASAISFSPTGTIAATDVQAAIAEVASEASGGSAPIALGDRHKTGRYYTCNLVSALGGNSGPNANWFMAFPLVINATTSFDRIGVGVTSLGAAGAVMRPGIYDDDGDGFPADLVLDAGTIAVDSGGTGFKEATISLSLTPGLYWVGAPAQVTVTSLQINHLSSTRADWHLSTWPIGWTTPNISGSTALARSGWLQITGMSGALPLTFGTPSQELGVTTGIPAVWLRAA